jgi:octanoyl-[GcvH]:protein N-octanoyltransferase
MRIVRGRGPTPERDRELTRSHVDAVAETGEGTLRVWHPHRQVAFGRRDTNRDGYERARRIAAESGFETIERAVGGHAVCYTGETVSFVRATPVDDPRSGITERYERTSRTVQSALSDLGVPAREGEPDGAFCPGTHSLSHEGKIAGLAQRVRRDVAVVGGIVVVRDHGAIDDTIAEIYDALGIPFERGSTGSIARAGGDADPEGVRRRLETALSRGAETTTVQEA